MRTMRKWGQVGGVVLLVVAMVANPCHAATAQVVNISGSSVLDAIIGGQTVVKAEARAGAVLLGDVIDKTVRLTVGPAKLKILGRIAIEAGGIAAALLLEDWMENNGFRYDPNDPAVVQKEIAGTGWVPTSGSTGMGDTSCPYTYDQYYKDCFIGYFPTYAAADAAVKACSYDGNSYNNNIYAPGWNWSKWTKRTGRRQTPNQMCYAVYPIGDSGVQEAPSTWQTATPAQIEDAMEDSFEAGGQWGARKVLGARLGRSAQCNESPMATR